MTPERPQFWGIETTWPFYALAALSLALFAWGLARRVQRWHQVPGGLRPSPTTWLRALGRGLVGTPLLRGDRSAGLMHLLIAWGFTGLFLGTLLSGLDHWGPHFLTGRTYLVFSTACELSGAALLVGLAWAFARRTLQRVSRLEHRPVHLLVLAWLALAALSGFAVEGLRLAQQQPEWAAWSLGGSLVAALASPEAAAAAFAPTWWLHALICLGLVAALPWTPLFHVLAAPASLAVAGPRPYLPLDDRPEGHGLGPLWPDACTHCGRCVEVCPPAIAGEPFSARGFLLAHRSRDFDPALAWHCTACGACEQACPLDIATAEVVLDVRRAEIEEGTRIPSGIAEALERVQKYDNPWERSKRSRSRLARELSLPAPEERAYLAGCTAAVDTRAQDIPRAFTGVLARAEVPLGSLGRKEGCCGHVPRRLGEDGLFEDKGLDLLDRLDGVAEVVTSSPHCLHTLREDLGALGEGVPRARHAAEVLAELVDTGRLTFEGRLEARATFHDPCWLGRHAGIYDAPRRVLAAIPGLELVEMPRHGPESFCCGAGGGRMWNEDPDASGSERIPELRIQEAATTGAGIVVTACPRCLVMLEDARKTAGLEDLRVMDLAEVAAAAQE